MVVPNVILRLYFTICDMVMNYKVLLLYTIYYYCLIKYYYRKRNFV